MRVVEIEILSKLEFYPSISPQNETLIFVSDDQVCVGCGSDTFEEFLVKKGQS